MSHTQSLINKDSLEALKRFLKFSETMASSINFKLWVPIGRGLAKFTSSINFKRFKAVD